jgi:hypothetical protein
MTPREVIGVSGPSGVASNDQNGGGQQACRNERAHCREERSRASTMRSSSDDGPAVRAPLRNALLKHGVFVITEHFATGVSAATATARAFAVSCVPELPARVTRPRRFGATGVAILISMLPESALP